MQRQRARLTYVQQIRSRKYRQGPADGIDGQGDGSDPRADWTSDGCYGINGEGWCIVLKRIINGRIPTKMYMKTWKDGNTVAQLIYIVDQKDVGRANPGQGRNWLVSYNRSRRTSLACISIFKPSCFWQPMQQAILGFISLELRS